MTQKSRLIQHKERPTSFSKNSVHSKQPEHKEIEYSDSGKTFEKLSEKDGSELRNLRWCKNGAIFKLKCQNTTDQMSRNEEKKAMNATCAENNLVDEFYNYEPSISTEFSSNSMNFPQISQLWSEKWFAHKTEHYWD